ncbi:MAG: hypothetical protein IKU60_03770 [Clostridia bacterium]|nr:hypothetical protein [Clostridia bacterium]
MTVKELYEKVCLRLPLDVELSERKFINFLEDTLSELEVLVSKKYLWLNTGAEKHPTMVSGEKIWCNDLFHNAIIENNCYLLTGDDNKKSLFYKYVEEGKGRVKERQNGNKIRVMPKW